MAQRSFAATVAQAHLEIELQQLDQALESLRPQIVPLRQHLETARKVFSDFGQWQASRQIQRGEDFQKSLNTWLELQALADLVSKYYEVAATLAQARRSGWQPRPEHQALFDTVSETPERIEYLRKCREELAIARDTARGAVHNWGSESQTAENPAGAGPEARPPRLHLTDSEVTSLNQLGAWLPSLVTESAGKDLGDLFREALREDDVRTRAKIAIGSRGGMEVALREVGETLEALRRVESLPPDHTGGAADGFRRCKSALAANTR